LENKICLDSDFLVNFLRKNEDEASFIRKHENSTILATTPINIFELYYGAYKSANIENVSKVIELEKRLKILPVSSQATKKAGQILAQLEKQGNLIDFRDLLIGCVAQTAGFTLKTYNIKHFKRIQEPIII
jgi:tRNA(fMet)-specific endonuclease VapC